MVCLTAGVRIRVRCPIRRLCRFRQSYIRHSQLYSVTAQTEGHFISTETRFVYFFFLFHSDFISSFIWKIMSSNYDFISWYVTLCWIVTLYLAMWLYIVNNYFISHNITLSKYDLKIVTFSSTIITLNFAVVTISYNRDFTSSFMNLSQLWLYLQLWVYGTLYRPLWLKVSHILLDIWQLLLKSELDFISHNYC